MLIRAPGRGGIFVICVSDSIRGMIPGHSTHVGCRLDRALRTGVKGDQATNPRREAVRRLAAASATNRQSRTLRQLPDPSDRVNTEVAAQGCGWQRISAAKPWARAVRSEARSFEGIASRCPALGNGVADAAPTLLFR